MKSKKTSNQKANARKKAVKIPSVNKAGTGQEVKEVKATIIRPEECPTAEDLKVPNDFPWTLPIAEAALRHVDPNIERSDWWKIMAGIVTEFGKTAETNSLLNRWSAGNLHGAKTPERYDAAENQRQWNSVEPGHFTMARLYQLARDGGWDPAELRREQAKEDGSILTGLDDSKTIAGQVWDKIEEQERERKTLFRYGRQIARMGRDIEVLTRDAFWQELAKRLTFRRVAGKQLVRCDPPNALITYILNTPAADIPLPELLGLTRTPVIAPDGSVHGDAGYSPASKLFHFPSSEVEAVPDRPTVEQVKSAREILEEVICDFPFVDLSDKAHTLGLMILPFVRPMIEGATPIHFLTKPTQGTGATLLGEMVTLIKTGKPLEAANAPRDDDEWRKTIVAKLLELPEFFFLDNVTKIRSEALATALTADIYEGRRLGVSEIVRVPVRCVWIMTGNNPELSADFPRRIVHIRLDANMDDPSKGREFKHNDLKGWVREQRGRLITAILTLSRAWITAGKPKPSITLASFEHWAHVVGGILELAEVKGFLQTPEERKHFDDPWQQIEREFIACWLQQVLKDRVTYQKAKSRFLLKMAESNELQLGQGMRSNEHGHITQFGMRLNRMRDKTFVMLGVGYLEEPIPEVKVKVVRHGPNGDAYWILELKEEDYKGLEPSSCTFWSGIPI